MHSPFLRLTALCALLGGAASALTPPAGWVSAGSSVWRDSSGACVLREQSFTQPLPVMAQQQDALSFGNKLLLALSKQGMTSIAVQPVSQDSDWGVLLAYVYTAKDVNYQIAQLFLSRGGKLHTVTGSSAQGEASPCVGVMRDFLKGR